MNQEVYQSLTYKEKMMFDELVAFSRRLTDRMDEIKVLLQTILKQANG